MKAEELFNVGNMFMNEGRIETAMDLWTKTIEINPQFAPVHLNMHNVYRQQGNLVKAKEALIRFINCPITGTTLDIIPSVRAQIADLEKQLNPQPQVPPPQPK